MNPSSVSNMSTESMLRRGVSSTLSAKNRHLPVPQSALQVYESREMSFRGHQRRISTTTVLDLDILVGYRSGILFMQRQNSGRTLLCGFKANSCVIISRKYGSRYPMRALCTTTDLVRRWRPLSANENDESKIY